MSPWYEREPGSNNWTKFNFRSMGGLPVPEDIGIGPNPKRDYVRIFPVPGDPEQLRIYVHGDAVVTNENRAKILRGDRDEDGDGVLVNRRDLLISHLGNPDWKVIIHSEKPIK